MSRIVEKTIKKNKRGNIVSFFEKVITVEEVGRKIKDRCFTEKKGEAEKKFRIRSKFISYLKKEGTSFPKKVAILRSNSAWLAVRIEENPFTAEVSLFETEAEARAFSNIDFKNWLERQPATGQSMAFSILPIIHALDMKKGKHWEVSNPDAQEILRLAEKIAQEKDGLQPEELKTLLTSNVQEVNDFLLAEGMAKDFVIEQIQPGSVFMAAIMSIAVQWVDPGEPREIRGRDGNLYPGIWVESQKTLKLKTTADGDKIMILCTELGDKVCLMKSPKPKNGFEAWKKAMEMQNVPKETIGAQRLCGHFPMVCLDREEEVPLAGAVDDSRPPMLLLQSRMKNLFTMDEFGAVVKSVFVAEGFSMGEDYTTEIMKVDEPFILWIEREDVSFPLFAGWFDYGEWRDPKDQKK